jgi:acetolactate synthase I/II/III large subunit
VIRPAHGLKAPIEASGAPSAAKQTRDVAFAELRRCGIYPTTVEQTIVAAANRSDYLAFTMSQLLERGSVPDGLVRGLLLTGGREPFVKGLATLFETPQDAVETALDEYLRKAGHQDLVLTGADVVAIELRRARVQEVFAYAGTSELALCDRIARTPGLQLVNSYGDKECAFMAGGASLIRPGRASAILHGARGSTNALGAIADLRRNEVGVLLLVGMASTGSAPFLPPHAEPGLLTTLGAFAKGCYEAESSASDTIVNQIRTLIRLARTRPFGPTILGLPQDLSEKAWIPWECVARPASTRINGRVSNLEGLARALVSARRPLILVDDYFLSYPQARTRLATFSRLIGAPVLQVRYRRGPMLFERLSSVEVTSFLGWFDPHDSFHRQLISESDLIITLEDRNLYPRVVGRLPDSPKIAITSCGDRTSKNGYLTPSDTLIEGDVGEILSHLNGSSILRKSPRAGHRWWTEYDLKSTSPLSQARTSASRMIRTGIVEALVQAFGTVQSPVLVDDSQMFGGLLSEDYDRFPTRLRIFGSHGGFVGCGIGYATGLAIGDPGVTVVCALGDQGFTNGLQGLVAAGHEQARVTFLVCNNGGSVSLRKQSQFDDQRSFDGGKHEYLNNAGNIHCTEVASALGIPAISIDLSQSSRDTLARAIEEFAERLLDNILSSGPRLIELRMPPTEDLWTGVWATTGSEAARIPSTN